MLDTALKLQIDESWRTAYDLRGLHFKSEKIGVLRNQSGAEWNAWILHKESGKKRFYWEKKISVGYQQRIPDPFNFRNRAEWIKNHRIKELTTALQQMREILLDMSYSSKVLEVLGG